MKSHPCLLLLFALAAATPLAAAELADTNTVITTTAERSSQSLQDVPRAVSITDGQDIQERLSRSTPEALRFEPGVAVQRTNQGGGSPFIRGLTGNQVLLMVDGIRVNNSTVRGGPNQYLNTIDPLAIERIEVVRGVGSVLYGSDALGGTVNVITRRRTDFRERYALDTTLLGRVSTAEEERNGAFFASTNLGSRVGFAGAYSRKEFGEVMQGGDLGRFVPSGYKAEDFTGNFDFILAEGHTLQLGGQYSRAEDVPAYSPGDLLRDFDPQVRNLLSLRYIGEQLAPGLEVLEVTGAFHDQREGRNRIRPNTPSAPNRADLNTKEEDRVETAHFSVRAESVLSTKHRLVWGAETYQDEVSSDRSEVNSRTGAVRVLTPALADGSKFEATAAYIQGQLQFTDWLRLVPGLRYSMFNIEAELDNATLGQVRIEGDTDDLTWSLHSKFDLHEQHQITLGVARGFRTPSIEELTRLASEDGRFNVPNPELGSETMISYELGYRLWTPKYRASVYGYYNMLDDLIARKPASFGGQTVINGEPVWRNENVASAYIYGAEADFWLNPWKQWEFRGTFASSYGNDEDEQPLRRMQPIHGTVAARWTSGDARWYIEPYFLYAAKQIRLSSGDKGDSRIPAGGTPGFLTYNLRLHFVFSQMWNMSFVAENLSDEKYKYHGSGVYEPGLNFKASLALNLAAKK